MGHRRREQGVEDRLGETDAGVRFLQFEETHVESRVVGDQHGIPAKLVEGRQNEVDGGWPRTMSSVMPWMGMLSGFRGAQGTSWLKISWRSKRLLTMRTAPI